VTTARPRPSWIAPLTLIAALVTVAAFAPVLAPHDPTQPLDMVQLKYHAPTFAMPFGTDRASRDVFSRVLFGARVSLAVAAFSVAVSLTLGTLVGAVAAAYGGVIDAILMRTIDLLYALPRLLVLLFIGSLWDNWELTGIVLVLGFTGWFDVARLVRSEVQAQLGREYLLAARASGVRRSRLLWRHVLPHLLPVLSVAASVGVAQTISLEAGLGFLGFGLQEPIASWGSILRDGSAVVRTYWWLTFFPGIATITAVLACSWLGDALRELFAPKQVPA